METFSKFSTVKIGIFMQNENAFMKYYNKINAIAAFSVVYDDEMKFSQSVITKK